MKTCRGLFFSIFMGFILSAPTRADIVNGSFETGDLTGWTWTGSGGIYYVDGGEYPIDYPFDPLTNPFFANPQISVGAGGVDGGFMSRLYNTQVSSRPVEFVGPDGQTYRFYREYYTLSLQQEIELAAGDIVSGWATLGTWERDTDYLDFASVTINDDLVWLMDLSGAVQDSSGETWDMGPWQRWEWTAPDHGRYLLSLNAYGDDQESSAGYFDGIQVIPVPEPSATLLAIVLSAIWGGKLIRRHRGR